MPNNNTTSDISTTPIVKSLATLLSLSIGPRIYHLYSTAPAPQTLVKNSLLGFALVTAAHLIYDFAKSSHFFNEFSDTTFDFTFRMVTTPLFSTLFTANTPLLHSNNLIGSYGAIIKTLSMLATSVADITLSRSLASLIKLDSQKALDNLVGFQTSSLIKDVPGYALMFTTGSNVVDTLYYGALGQAINKIIGYGISHNSNLDGLTLIDLAVDSFKGATYNYGYFLGYSFCPADSFMQKLAISSGVEMLHLPFSLIVDWLYQDIKNASDPSNKLMATISYDPHIDNTSAIPDAISYTPQGRELIKATYLEESEL